MKQAKYILFYMSFLFVYFTTYDSSWSNVIENLLQKDNRASVVFVTPDSNIQKLVDQNPPGTTFLIQAGTHRLQQIRPKQGNSFIGSPGAILSGATEIDNFSEQGTYWVAEVTVPDIPQKGKCEKQRDGTPFNSCMAANDLFLNDQALLQVMSLQHVEAGKWFLDPVDNKIYIADNPVGSTLEISTKRYAIYGSSNNITIRNLIIEKYANPAQEGAIHPMNAAQGPLGKHWQIDSNEVKFNHGVGIRLGHYMRVTNNNIHHNGQLGIGGAGSGITIEDNEIAYNNTQGFDSHWEAGGSKFSRTENLTVKGNYVHHNKGPGLWTDGNNIHTLYESNRVLENSGPGIFHEISYSAVIKENVVEKNGFQFQKWVEGAGILVSSSSDVEVVGNTVRNNFHGICGIQTQRGEGKYGAHEIRNLNVHNNIIVMERGMTGLVVQDLNHSFFKNKNNRFNKNTYYLAEKMGVSFRWYNGSLNKKEWQKFGQDVEGSFF
ncbi:MAG: right-handed parallel beta-helix repeat-containing protein [Nitrospira sp.]|nr:right-handed parallel beta-helix repeat-containing protein [Nitrospira sp.]